MNFRRILIAVDGSPLAAHAANVGIELARSLGGEVAFIHVVDPAHAYAPEGGVSPAVLLAQAEEDGKRLLAELRQRASPQPTCLEFLAVGKPNLEILKAANEWPADIIVIGSHGSGGLTRLLVGSVAEAVMRHASCPVLVVRSHS
jgi:nucleotide-binding universal stress UspA family protein